MSLHYEVVFACFLRDDTPTTVLSALRWHLGLRPDRPADLEGREHDFPLLLPAGEAASRLPGGETAVLRRQFRHWRPGGVEVWAWGLFSRNQWPDDAMGELTVILDLIARHVAEDGYVGHFREENNTRPAFFAVRGGRYEALDA